MSQNFLESPLDLISKSSMSQYWLTFISKAIYSFSLTQYFEYILKSVYEVVRPLVTLIAMETIFYYPLFLDVFLWCIYILNYTISVYSMQKNL